MRFHTAAEAYRDCLDYAFLQTSTGMTDYNTAVRNATRRLTESGLQFVDYASGVRNHADVAVRRAVLTGLSQYTGKISEKNAQELDTDIVEVSAHMGARPDHAEWQGRWYSLSGKSKKYPSLVQVTGYGTVTGLKGANCRHDFYTVIPGISEPSYTEEELRNIDPPPFEYNGKTYTCYEATQRQRYMERAMRKTKRELLAADSTGDKDRFTEKSVLLRRQREDYNKFSKAAGLLTQNERTQVGGYEHSIAGKVTATYNQLLTWGSGNATIGLKAYYFKKEIANGNVKLDVDTKNQNKHLYGRSWKNQVKQSVQAIKAGKKSTPRSALAKGLDPQQLINTYAGKGDGYKFTGKKYPDEYISLPYLSMPKKHSIKTKPQPRSYR
ncbi:MAG: phage minor capsid protein [Huintestinicola sp.]